LAPYGQKQISDTRREQAFGYDKLNAFLQDGCAFLMARKIIQKILEGVTVIAGGIWLLAPVTRYLGLVAFAASTVVLFICFFGLRLLNDGESGWWPPRKGPGPD
jgi:hypothetical protein